MWRWQREALAADYQVIQYDLLGHGESAKPAGPYLMAHMVEQIAELMAALNIPKATLIGFSLGGLIVRAFALAHADKTQALVILNSAHARTRTQRNAILERVEQAEKDGPSATIDAALVRWFSEEFGRYNPRVLDQVRSWVTQNDADVYPAVYRLLANGDIGLEEAIATIECPTLIMTGEKDFGNSPEMADQMGAIMPNAKVAILPGLRHMALAENPEMVNSALLEFLGQHSTDA
jgi:pimeloyl-ACP methyl ester carboxylesterase